MGMYSRCARCMAHGPHGMAIRVFRNRSEHVFWRCRRCGAAVKPGTWIPHREVPDSVRSELPRFEDAVKPDDGQGNLF